MTLNRKGLNATLPETETGEEKSGFSYTSRSGQKREGFSHWEENHKWQWLEPESGDFKRNYWSEQK